MMTYISLDMALQSNFCNRDFVYDHKFSMRLRSGEFQQKYLETPFLDIPGFQDNLTHSSSLFQMNTWDNMLLKFSSIRKSPLPLISGMDFLSITSVYLYKFIIPSIGRSEPTPEKLKMPQTIFFEVLHYLIEIGRT